MIPLLVRLQYRGCDLHSTECAPILIATLSLRYRVHLMWFQGITALINVRPSIKLNHIRHVSDLTSSWTSCFPFVS